MLIYKITNMINGKLYVGQTTRTLEQRKWQHLNAVKRGHKNHLYNAMRKYGVENFKFETICEVENLEDLNLLERYYIAKYNCIEDGYNMVDGGNNNVMFIDSVKKKHALKMRSKETRKHISDGMKKYRQEHPFTEEHKAKLSKSAMGNHNFGTGDTRSIACYCLDKNLGRVEFKNYKEAGIWWFNNYHPFGDTYSQATYQRKIIDCIKTGKCRYKKPGYREIIITEDEIRWYRK